MRSVSFLHVLLTSLVALAPACSQDDAGQPCATDANCPARARCLEKLCVADAPPVASIEGLHHAVDHALATFDGSGSSDPDAGDGVLGWRWTLRPTDAACAAPAPPPSAPIVHVRFPCAGQWAVELVAVDALGAESAVATHHVEVSAWAGPERVTAGDDRSVPHGCTAAPAHCTTVDAEGAAVAVPLASAMAASDADEGTLTWAWSVTPPPGLALTGGRRVRLSPGPEAQSPTALIETDGLAISGQWLFTVEIRDAAGVIGTASQVVTVENREPVITATLPATVPHHYDPSHRFIASGAIPIVIVDPDGDPVTRRPLLGRHLNDGPNDTFEVADTGDVLTYYAEVRYDLPEDALHLIGEGVVRELELTVDDVNGATATATLPIVVGNNPPRALMSMDTVTTGHAYDAETATYRAAAKLTRWVDDDGDPLVPIGATGDGMCDRLTVDETGQATVACALAFEGSPAVGQFAATHVVKQRIQDPWEPGPVVAPANVVITNRAPVVSPVTATVTVTCGHDDSECCEWFEDRCVLPLKTFGAGSTIVSPVVTDPDGDPVLVEATSCESSTRRTCFGGACSLTVSTCASGSCDGDPDTVSGIVVASDGGATDSEAYTIGRTCK